MAEWAEQEAQGIDLKDARLNSRYVQLLSSFGDAPERSIPAVCTGWADTKAAYRFIGNDRIDPADLLKPHTANALRRIQEFDQSTILCLQDTSFCEYHSQKATTGLGPHTHDYERGFFLHPLLAMTPEGIPLGVLDVQTWARSYKDEKPADPPIEKESARWIRMLQRTDAIAADMPGRRFITVGDRESDFFEFLAYRRQHCHYLVRSKHNRMTMDGEPVHDAVKKKRVAKYVDIIVPKHDNRPAREITAAVRYGTFTILPPSAIGGHYEPQVVTVVHIAETGTSSRDEPFEWFLLTSVPCRNGDEANQIAQWYAARWGIEVFFRTLKTGCRVEELQMDTRIRIERAVMMYMIIAWRVMYLVMAGKELGHLSAAAFFDKDEWQGAHIVERKRLPPRNPPTLKETLWIIADLGGFLKRKGDGHPGPKSIWIGLQRIHDMSVGIAAMREAMQTGGTCG